jgi:hypothetical protein
MGSTHQLLGDVRTKVAQDDSNTDGTAIRERLRRDPHPHPRSSVMRVAMLMRSSILDPHRETSRTWKRFVFFLQFRWLIRFMGWSQDFTPKWPLRNGQTCIARINPLELGFPFLQDQSSVNNPIPWSKYSPNDTWGRGIKKKQIRIKKNK